jgi:4-amino-4-deoxy-L-arabinose transferase-like glycosyltransferase
MNEKKSLWMKSSGQKKSLFFLLTIVFIIGFVLRLGLVLKLPDKVFWIDEKDYLNLSDRMLKGQGFVNDGGMPSAFRPIGYPLMLTALKMAGIKSLFAIRFFQVLIGLLTSWIVYLYAREIFNKQTACWAAFLSAVYPYFIFIPGTLLSTTFLCFFILIAYFWLYKASQSGLYRFFILSGVAFGVAILIQPTTLVLVIAAVLWTIRFFHPDYKKAFQSLLIFLIVCSAIVAPWSLRNYSKLHTFSLVTNGGRNLWLGNNPQATENTGSAIDHPDSMEKKLSAARLETEYDKIYYTEAARYIRQNLKAFIIMTIRKGLAFWRLDPSPTTSGYVQSGILLRLASIASFGPLLALALLAVVYAAPGIKRNISLWLYSAVLYTLVHAVFISKVRYRLPLDYFVIMLACFSGVSLFSLIRQKGIKQVLSDMLHFKLQLLSPPGPGHCGGFMRLVSDGWQRLRDFFLRDRRRILLAILTVALILRVVFVCFLDPCKFYFSDTRHYDTAARSLLAGNGFGDKFYRTPLYPMIMAGVYALFGSSFLSMRLFEACVSILLCLAAYQLGKHIVSPATGLILAALIAVHPHFIILPGILYATNLYTLFLALTVLCLIKTDDTHPVLFGALAGLFAGMASLTVPAVFFVFPFWMLWILFRPATSFFKRLALMFIFLMTFMLVLSPWTIRNYKKYGQLVLVQPLPNKLLPDLVNKGNQDEKIKNGFKDVADYYRQYPQGTKADRLSNTFKHYLEHPLQACRYALREQLHFWALYPDRLNTANPAYRQKIYAKDPRMAVNSLQIWPQIKLGSIIVMLPVFIFALYGLFHINILRRETILMFLIILTTSFGYSLLYAEVRYRIPIEPYILFFTAVGMQAFYSLYFKSRVRR